MDHSELKKYQHTMEIFSEYERRFSEAKLKRKPRCPWLENDRQAIINDAKKLLRWDDALVPEIRVISEREQLCDGYFMTDIVYESWDGFFGIATLFGPPDKEVHPIVFQCTGHSAVGRMSDATFTACVNFAKCGCYAVANENIGHGEREAQGHWDVVAPFACGLTLQGLIVMETVALIRYMQKKSFVDKERMGACGNSGGGTLTTFLAALAPELSAIASTGYPSEFSYILQKEREHCACNLLMGVAGMTDMWEIESVFAPKPLLLEQGRYDCLIPLDYFYRNARKVGSTYVMLGAQDKFSCEVTETKHSWEAADISVVTDFFIKSFGLPARRSETGNVLLKRDREKDRTVLPSGLSVYELSQKLSGISVKPDIKLEEVFRPTYHGIEISPDDIVRDVGRGDLMRVFAQFESALLE